MVVSAVVDVMVPVVVLWLAVGPLGPVPPSELKEVLRLVVVPPSVLGLGLVVALVSVGV